MSHTVYYNMIISPKNLRGIKSVESFKTILKAVLFKKEYYAVSEFYSECSKITNKDGSGWKEKLKIIA